MEKKNYSFYCCSDCLHVYFNLPDNDTCVICHNEILKEDILSELDIISCETCHSLYTVQNIDDLIPNNIENPNFLCSCKHHCPTNSVLSIGIQEAYVGNIVHTDIFKCSNCGSISYRNMENGQKSCTECNSRFVQPLHIDFKTQKTFFKCANPEHKIRLKIRDLIINNNQLIENEIIKIKIQEEHLQNQYNIKRKEIEQKYINKGLIDKIKDIPKKQPLFLDEVIALNNKTKKERLALYSYLNPIGLRCTVYQTKKNENTLNFVNTHAGCGAIAHMRIRKIVIAPDGTIIDREPEKKKSTESSSNQIDNINTSDKWIPSVELKKIKESNLSILTKKLRNNENEETMIQDPLKNTDFNSLPSINQDQMYLLIELHTVGRNSELSQLINTGVIPLVLPEENSIFKIGRNNFLRAYWKNIALFEENQKIFDNISPNTENSCQFGLKMVDNNLYFVPGINSISKSQYLTKDGNLEDISKPILINSITSLILKANTIANMHSVPKKYHYQFIISIQRGE